MKNEFENPTIELLDCENSNIIETSSGGSYDPYGIMDRNDVETWWK